MKTHTTAGEELLIRAKEELGKEIPLCARIMAVADVFDALTSRRCYKKAMPLEKAYAIIREESGTHFDPAVVEAFFAVDIGEWEFYMTKKLFCQAIIKFVMGVLSVGVLLFLPAGTFYYWQAWLLIAILFIPMFFAGIIMMLKNPELLQKRLNAKEEENEQKQVIALSGIMFLAAFIVAGLNIRFDLFILPTWISYVAAIIFLFAYVLYAEVLRENMYLSRTVEVQENQKVIDTGLYGIVRHPMYMVTLFLFLSMPLILGSVLSFLIILFYIPIIIKRIKNEEKVLEQGLKGYLEYEKKVKYKIIPYIW